MGLTFRVGKTDDKEQLKRLGLISYGQFKNVLTDDNWNKLNQFLTDENSYRDLLRKSKCFVCENDGLIIGMAYIIPKGNPTDIFQEDWCYIRMVGVHPDFAGKGIGKKLTQMCIEHAKATDEKIMALHTSEFMYAARHIYEKIGFIQMQELEPRLGKKYWLYKLKL